MALGFALIIMIEQLMEVYVEIELQTEDSYEKICVLLFLLRIKATFLIVHQPIYTQQHFSLVFPPYSL